MKDMAAANFKWEDPLLLEEQLTTEERLVRDAAREYAQDKLAPRVVEAFRREHTDTAIFREMGSLGLLGATIPEEFGGGGLNYVSYGLIAREVERVDSGFRSMMSVQSSLVMLPIHQFGTVEQKRRYLPSLARGESDRLLRTHRAQPRLRSGQHDHARARGERRVSSDGVEDLDHQQSDRRRVRRVGKDGRRRDPRVHSREGREGPDGARTARQGRLAGIGHGPDRHGRCVRAQGVLAAGGERPERARSPASIPRATASPGARSARPRAAGTPRAITWWSASSSAGRSPPISWCRRSSPTCRPRSRSGCRRACGWGA